MTVFLDANVIIKPLDALHLAAAVDSGCGKFVNNDTGLRGFPDTNVEILV